MFYLTTHSTHLIYGYVASEQQRRTDASNPGYLPAN